MTRMIDAALEVLAPLVGGPAATMCVHSAAMSLEKSADTLSIADWPAVAERIRRDMRPFTSPELLDSALTQIRDRIS